MPASCRDCPIPATGCQCVLVPCECGCGLQAPLAKRSDQRSGHVKGQPVRFIRGHRHRVNGPEYAIEDQGFATPCWIWQRCRDRHGYGKTYSKGAVRLAHRVLYERLVGPIPKHMQLDHLCRNRACVNPHHLEPVDNSENLRRGKHIKLSQVAVNDIRNSEDSNVYLAKRHGIHPAHVSKVRSGRAGRLWTS